MSVSGKKIGRQLPMPSATVKTMNDRLNVAVRTSIVVVSARYAFQVARYIASPRPPTIAEVSRRAKFDVKPGTAMTRADNKDPINIICLRPWRSDRIANGIPKTTADTACVLNRSPTVKAESSSRGKKTASATS
jgi:hypothetical protein